MEAKLLSLKGVEQAIVFGDAQPYLSAVLVIPDVITESQLCSMIKAMNEQLPDYARVMSWVRTHQRFSVEEGTMTETGKPRRETIAKQYEAASRSNWEAA